MIYILLITEHTKNPAPYNAPILQETPPSLPAIS